MNYLNENGTEISDETKKEIEQIKSAWGEDGSGVHREWHPDVTAHGALHGLVEEVTAEMACFLEDDFDGSDKDREAYQSWLAVWEGILNDIEEGLYESDGSGELPASREMIETCAFPATPSEVE